MLIDVFFYSLTFSIGFIIGSTLASSKYEKLAWHTMKWNPDCLGFRRVPNGTKILKGEKAVLCVELRTDQLKSGQALLVDHGEEKE